jgi:hypothetical protein
VLFADPVADIAVLTPATDLPLRDELAVEIALGAGAHHGPTTMPGRHEAQDPWLRYDAAALGRVNMLCLRPNADNAPGTEGFSGSPMFDANSRLVAVYNGRHGAHAFAAPVQTLPVWFTRALGG